MIGYNGDDRGGYWEIVEASGHRHVFYGGVASLASIHSVNATIDVVVHTPEGLRTYRLPSVDWEAARFLLATGQRRLGKMIDEARPQTPIQGA